jgi:hypothetical protein
METKGETKKMKRLTLAEKLNGIPNRQGGKRNEIDKYYCSYCDKYFRIKRTFLEHVNNKHKDLIKSAN